MICDTEGDSERPCILSNFSNAGAKITGVRPATVPDEFMLRITPRGRMRKCRVLWRSTSSDTLGALFTDLFPSVEEPHTGDAARDPVAS